MALQIEVKSRSRAADRSVCSTRAGMIGTSGTCAFPKSTMQKSHFSQKTREMGHPVQIRDRDPLRLRSGQAFEFALGFIKRIRMPRSG
jgi:hypothetical protein